MKLVALRWLLAVVVASAAGAAYPAFVLGYTWFHVLRSDLPGGTHGPLDAYRHTLASAVVAYTLGPAAVELAIELTERGSRGGARMDRHNDSIGGRIGLVAERFSDIEPAVRARVLQGTADSANPQQSTWLPRGAWRRDRLW